MTKAHRRIILVTAILTISLTIASLPPGWILGPQLVLAATVVVNSNTDVADGNTTSIANLIATPGPDGVISLREAITAANNTAGADVINFNIGGGGNQTIQPTTALPAITDTVTIDGFSQPTAVFDQPKIELNGQNAGGGAHGLHLLNVNQCVIRGLVINRFTENGISINQGAGNKIQGNFIGTDSGGNASQGNRANGVLVTGDANIIGTDGDGTNDASEGNLISGNNAAANSDGVSVTGAGTDDNVVAGNRIGTNIAGTGALANQNVGVRVQGSAKRTRVGTNGDGVSDTLESNLIGGQNLHDDSRGVFVTGAGTNDTVVAGNRVGLNPAGTGAVANRIGISVGSNAERTIIGTNGDGNGDTVEGNVVSGNTDFGIELGQCTNSRVSGNIVGPGPTGSIAQPNRVGINIQGNSFDHVIGTNGDGISDVAERNLISGNNQNGIEIIGNARRITVAGNFIGTNVSGTSALANGGHGVSASNSTQDHLIGGTAAGTGNRIAFNGGAGIAVTETNTTKIRIFGNSIFSNNGQGIDLGNNGPTPNDVNDSDSGPNDLQNKPVLILANSTGVTGVLTSTPNKVFRIEFFSNTAADPSSFGEGETFVGFTTVTTGPLGTVAFSFSGTLTAGQSASATATSLTDSQTSEFSGNVPIEEVPPAEVLIGGSVFEDIDYGGGVGRLLGTLSAGATIELYDASGGFLQSTTADSEGNYFFSVTAKADYFVRVVNGSVTSSRPGSVPGLFAVQTFRTDASSGTSAPVINEIGGAVPAAQDSGPKTTGGTLSDPAVEQSVTPVSVGTSPISQLDFGFNFNTVVNTNDAGQGSLRQFIINSNALLNAGGPPTGVDRSIFMIPGSGLKTINPATALPPITAAETWIDGWTQGGIGYIGPPLIQLTGSLTVPTGLTLAASNCLVRGLIINGFGGDGILISGGSNNIITGNYVGTNPTGNTAVPNSTGIRLVLGNDNLVGTNGDGVNDATESNLISGNNVAGLDLSINSSGNRVAGNRIGTDLAGTAALPNIVAGVNIRLGATGNFIGPDGNASPGELAEANIIAFNGGEGVRVTDDTTLNNSLLGNSIFSNANLGIDLGNSGPTANDNGDGDSGPNNLQNYPVIISATPTGIIGTLNTTANATCRLEFFSNAVADPSGFGEGQTFLGSISVTTDGSGNVNFTFPVALTIGQFVTATATVANSTSEFSAPLGVSVPTISVQDAAVREPSLGAKPMHFVVVLSQPAPVGGVTVHYSTEDQTPGVGHATAGSDYTAVPDTVLTFLPGQQLKVVSVDVLADSETEPDETFLLNLSAPTGATILDGEGMGTIRPPLSPTPASGTLIITELRTSGPAGPEDEFVELYNNTDQPITISSVDLSPGYGVFKKGADCDSLPVLIGTIPNNTVIPPGGHFLLTGSTYSLSGYAVGDATLTSDIENDGNIGVFTTANVLNLSTATRLDAVGFGANTGNVCDLLLEGTTLAAVNGTTLEHAFYRDLCGKGGSVSVMGPCPSRGLPVDSDNNATDFLFANTTGASTPAGERVGAPGPQNSTAPIVHNTSILESLVDPALPAHVVPNRFRDQTPDPPNNATFGTLTVNRKFTNNTSAPVSQLRFRIVDLTSRPVTGNLADLRALNSTDVTVSITGGGTVVLRGTTLETQIIQPMGGAMNSTLAAGSVSLASPLGVGESIGVQFKLGVQKGGSFKIWVNIEALQLPPP